MRVLTKSKGQRQERGEESCDELRANIGGQAVAGQLLELFQGCLDAAAPQVESSTKISWAFQQHTNHTLTQTRSQQTGTPDGKLDRTLIVGGKHTHVERHRANDHRRVACEQTLHTLLAGDARQRVHDTLCVRGSKHSDRRQAISSGKQLCCTTHYTHFTTWTVKHQGNIRCSCGVAPAGAWRQLAYE